MLVAAGAGTRLGAEVPKALVPLRGIPLYLRAARTILGWPGCAGLVVVAPRGYEDDLRAGLAGLVAEVRGETPGGETVRGEPARGETLSREPMPVDVVSGGAERGDSVLAGLRALPAGPSTVLVHDAARCLTPQSVFERVATAVLAGAPAVVPGVPVIDTVKVVDAAGQVISTPDRGNLRAVQTPQGFDREVLLRAHAVHGSMASDDAGLVERLGLPVLVVDGDAAAAKVTTAADLAAAERALDERALT